MLGFIQDYYIVILVFVLLLLLIRLERKLIFSFIAMSLSLAQVKKIVEEYNSFTINLLTSKAVRDFPGSIEDKTLALSKKLESEVILFKDIKPFFNTGDRVRLVFKSFFFNRHPLEILMAEYPFIIRAYTWWYK